MSTASAKPSPAKLPPDFAVKVRQLLAERQQKLEEHRTKTYVDEPVAVTVAPNGLYVAVAMQSGRIWLTSASAAGTHAAWTAVGNGPLPDTSARETFDELMALNRELKGLGHVDEEG